MKKSKRNNMIKIIAVDLGIKTILFKNAEQLKSDLRKFEVKI